MGICFFNQIVCRANKNTQNTLQNFKLFIRASVDARKPGASRTDQLSAQSTKNKLIEQLAQIDQVRLFDSLSCDDRADICVLQLLRERGTRYLLGTSMTEYDCELMPRLHHIRVAGMTRCCFFALKQCFCRR